METTKSVGAPGAFIKEVIVVEGRDDIDAVNKAVDADIIATHGYGISRATIERIRYAYEHRGIIILTDPDHAGQKIRERLTALFPDALQAYISKAEALSNHDVGVENAKPEVIRRAIEAAGRTLTEKHGEFTMSDMTYYSLTGADHSRELRDRLGRKLGIGYGNGKAFLKRLNNYGISRAELEKAVGELLDGPEETDALSEPSDLNDAASGKVKTGAGSETPNASLEQNTAGAAGAQAGTGPEALDTGGAKTGTGPETPDAPQASDAPDALSTAGKPEGDEING